MSVPPYITIGRLSARYSYVSIVDRSIYYLLYSVSRVNIIYIIKGTMFASGWFYHDWALLMILAASLSAWRLFVVN